MNCEFYIYEICMFCNKKNDCMSVLLLMIYEPYLYMYILREYVLRMYGSRKYDLRKNMAKGS